MHPWTELLNPTVALALLAVGLVGLLTRKRVMKQVICLSVMLQGALLSVIDAGRQNGQMQAAQGIAISALVVETSVLAIFLALIVNVCRYHPDGAVDDLDTLRG